MRNYYFIVPSLPPLSIHARPEISFEELMIRLQLGLSKKDLGQVSVLRFFVDLCNIRSLFMEEAIDLRGNLSEKQLDEALLAHAFLPEYVFEFLNQFESTMDKVRNFSGLLALFFNQEIPKQKGFLRSYLTFERECRLVLVGLRAKQGGRELVKELQFEDPRDPFVAHVLAQKDSERYDPPGEYEGLKELMLSCKADPWAEQVAFAKYRFERLKLMAEREVFSVGKVVCYVAQWMIVESLFELDRERGKMILDTFKSG